MPSYKSHICASVPLFKEIHLTVFSFLSAIKNNFLITKYE